jgi:hypothetical protein
LCGTGGGFHSHKAKSPKKPKKKERKKERNRKEER